MLKMGFQDDIEKIFGFIKSQSTNTLQNLLFSATMPDWIHTTLKKYMSKNRMYIDLVSNTESMAAKTVDHILINFNSTNRVETLKYVINKYGGARSRTICFTETKKDANNIRYSSEMKNECQVLHGDIPQRQREITLQGFRDGKFRLLIYINLLIKLLYYKDVW